MLQLWFWMGLGSAFASGEAEEAEMTFQLGTKDYGNEDYISALGFFLASNRLAPNPSVAFNIARCYAKLGKYAEAFRWFSVAGEGLTDPKIKNAIASELQGIIPKVVIYEMISDPPGATVYSERKELGGIGVTPLRIAMPPTTDDKARLFLFEREGWQSKTVEGVTGRAGQTISVQTSLVQVVGTIDIMATKGTSVHQGAPDGPVLCVAPCQARLPPGNWVLYFRREGFRDVARQFEVVADKTSTSVVDLMPNTGSVVINATERGALVEIDGTAVGFSPTVAQGVPVGERVVRVSRQGYEPVERTVMVEIDRSVTLDDIELIPLNEVSAVSRRAERLEFAPASVTVIGQEELDAFQYPTIYEALRGVRGFALTYDSVYGGTNVRGLGQANDFNNRLLVLQDGASLNDNFYLQSFISYDGRIDLGGIDRIEVVRGPGSVLYGTGAVSGVVNLVTDPFDSPEGTEIAVGTYDNHVLRARAQSHYNFNDSLGFRAAISGGTSQGREVVADPIGTENALVLDNFDKFDGATTHGRLWLGDATIQWYHSWRDVTIPTGIFFTRVNDSKHVWTDERTMAELRYEPKLSSTVQLLTRGTFNRYRYHGILPYPGYTSDESVLGLSGGGEIRLQIEPSESLRVTLGGVADHTPQASVYGEDTSRDGETSPPYIDADTPYTIGAGYGTLDLVPAPALRLNAGARLDYWSTFGLSISPRLSAILFPARSDTIKLMGGRAFRAPSIYEFSYDTPFQVAPDEGTLRPESVWSGELEYSHLFGTAWTGLLASHASLIDNLVTTIPAEGPDGGPALTYINDPNQTRILGFDAELRRTFQDGWMLSGFYSLLDPRTAGGELITNAPQHNAGLKVIIPISAPGARLAFRSSLEAPRRIDTLHDYGTRFAVISDLVLSGSVPERGISYAAGIYNLLDTSYSLPVLDNYPFRTMPQQGRSIMATLSARF